MSTPSNSRQNAESGDDRPRAGSPRRTNFLLVREAAEIMRMDESTLYRHLRRGCFPAVKVGGRYLVPAAAVEQMAEEALASGQCIVVEQWSVRWREERAAEALARGLTVTPRSAKDGEIGGAYSAGKDVRRSHPRGVNHIGAGSLSTPVRGTR